MALVLQSFSIELRRLLRYRFAFITSFFSQLILPVIINSVFVLGLLRPKPAVDKMALVAYVLLANIIFLVVLGNVEDALASDIKHSRLPYKLLLPKHPLLQYLLAAMAKKCAQIVFFYLPFLLILLFYQPGAWLRILQSVPLLLAAMWLGYCLSFIIGILSFFMTEIWGLSAVKTLLFALFSGALFPLTVLPQGVYRVLQFTPFPYICYYPTALVLNNKVDFGLAQILVLLMWCILFTAALLVLWRKGLQRFEVCAV